MHILIYHLATRKTSLVTLTLWFTCLNQYFSCLEKKTQKTMHYLLFLVIITGNIQRKHKPNILIALSCHNGMWPKCWSRAAVGLLRPYHLLQATV